jgi:hypothetical protein
MSKRSRNPKNGSKSKEPLRVPFGQRQLLEGEDAAAYDELLAGICAAVKPADIIDEMFIADVVSLEWEVLRWRRLKWRLLQAGGLKRLEKFVAEQLDYWPAPGSEDTELGVLMELEVGHGETEVYPRVQA